MEYMVCSTWYGSFQRSGALTWYIVYGMEYMEYMVCSIYMVCESFQNQGP